MAENKCFGPLTLHQKADKAMFQLDGPHESCCVLCEENFSFPEDEQRFLTHLFMKHRLVIGDFNDIADLKAYMTYWRLRFKDEGLSYFCTTMLLDDKPDGTKSKNEEYYLLSDVLPEDKELRQNLQQTRLEKLMEQHKFERENTKYEKECLFCRFKSQGTRATYLNHLYEKHNFHIAKPENLIFIDKLIDTIANKLERLQCIFCEGGFKDRNILKEHMRKKGHKRINPDNKEYDKYFLVNYTGEKKPSTNSKTSQRKLRVQEKRQRYYENADVESNADSDPDWSEWTEENSTLISCLICEHAETSYEAILNHMEEEHKFSFTNETSGLDFYQKIKIVNFIRRQMHLKQCLRCDATFDDSVNLNKHIKESNHLVLEKEKWDQPEYYFSTYEDDLFLCFIQDDDESWWSSDEKEIEKRNSMSDSISKEMAMAVLND